MERTVRVLLVDDEGDFIEPVSYWLQSKGYQILTASNGEEAIEVIKREQPDIVFMDINMPGMGGIDTLRQIRETNKDLPVIMLTAAYQDEKIFAKANELGIAGFFPKHSSLDDLGRIIEASLRLHSRRKPTTGK